MLLNLCANHNVHTLHKTLCQAFTFCYHFPATLSKVENRTIHNNIDETMCFCYQSITTTIKCIVTMKHHFLLTCCAKYMTEDVHQNGCFKCEILLLISQSVYLFLPVTFRLLSAIFFIWLPLNGDTIVILCRRRYLRVDIGLHLDSCCLCFFFSISHLWCLLFSSLIIWLPCRHLAVVVWRRLLIEVETCREEKW